MAAIQKKSVLRKSAWKGQALHVTLWEPATAPTALLYLSHGVCGHMGRYDALASSLAAEGILVFGHDHVGHGQSERDRVHIECYEQYVQDVIQTIEETKSRFASVSLCYLMGHSMDGLIVGLTAIERQDWFNPTWYIKSSSADAAIGTTIPEEAQACIEDDLVYHRSQMGFSSKVNNNYLLVHVLYSYS